MSPTASENSEVLQNETLEEELRYPGISVSPEDIEQLARSVRRRQAVYRFKGHVPIPWVVFIGGTGTGKSTIFNILCGETISKTGVERPQTDGPILYLHRRVSLGEYFPFSETLNNHGNEDGPPPDGTAGSAGSYTIIRHERDDLAHLILADAPDVDSVDRRHREIVDDLYLLADYIVFIASQEKYADAVPSSLLGRIMEDGKPCLFILNKASDSLCAHDVLSLYSRQGLTMEERNTVTIPYAPGGILNVPLNSEPLRNFRDSFFRTMTTEKSAELIDEGRKATTAILGDEIDRLVALLEAESEESEAWRARLDTLFLEKGRALLAAMADRYKKGNLLAIQKEVRRVFSRYDVLAGPRRYVARLVSMPLRLIGLRPRPQQDSRKKDLIDAGRRIDFTPVLFGIDDINRAVLEDFSPADVTAPLYRALRNPEVPLSPTEITGKLESLQEGLAAWLEDMFGKLMKGIPRHKELGIYSTSILWGTAIISFEIVLGGGFGLLEAILDSFIAPLVTKGSSELFAYNELRQIARELDSRNREGLLAILEEQKRRYHDSLLSVTTSEETLELLRRLRKEGETSP